ncbi:MAG: Ig-like domain-containing protein [Bacteroidota bacterium]
MPTKDDDVIIKDGHVITLSGSMYQHDAGLIIEADAELIMDSGDPNDGFIFNGTSFHIFGKLTLTFSPEKDLSIKGNSFFWAHDGAEIMVSDDMKLEGNSTSVIDNVCIEVDDDFHLHGTSATLCGSGGISIGTNTSSNTSNLQSSATTDQICRGMNIYRGPNGNCDTIVTAGTGNNSPVAVDDSGSTPENTPIALDVLYSGSPDSDSDGDPLQIQFAGINELDNSTIFGGSVTINDNGTPSDPSDDFVDYSPPTNFTGVDTFQYAIVDAVGGASYATVTVQVLASLPVTWIDFTATAHYCEVQLNWSTAEELNNDYIEIQRSTDGEEWETIDKMDGYGTTTSVSYYQYTDEEPQKTNYYRLRQVDFNGDSDYSAIVKASPACYENVQANGIVKLYPNPADDQQVTLTLNSAAEKVETIVVADMRGTPIYRIAMPLSAGANLIRLEIGHLPSGQYFVQAGKSTHALTIARD